MEVKQYRISLFKLTNGKTPYSQWFDKLKDRQAKAVIMRRITRAQDGNFGDYKQINELLYEMRITTGKGYRIYFMVEENEIILLLLGGDKSTQSVDIEKANKYIKEFKLFGDKHENI